MNLTADNIFEGITKIKPADGDTLLFYIKTDQNGDLLCDLKTVKEAAVMVSKLLEEQGKIGIRSLFLPNKICLSSVENSKMVIKSLEKSISYIQEAIDKIRNIENGNSEESFAVVDMSKIRDSFGRVL